ncbi:MAG: sigma 54-interacting transcriptional regulator [Acidobacteria bacterium]|nr:sigma 54-interacting transcriptional regulator [Acidobacteriota bacterium]
MKETDLASVAIPKPAGGWLLSHGPQQLEQLFRAVVFHPAVPIVITDDERASHDVSTGAARLLGLPRQSIIGQKLDDFTEPSFRPKLPELWETLLQQGAPSASLKLALPDGAVREVELEVRRDVLPVRHVVVLKPQAEGAGPPETIPVSMRDFALCLLDPEGEVVTWYGGSERTYGYRPDEIVGRSAAILYPAESSPEEALSEVLVRAEIEGYFATERWHLRKDGSTFWANSITMALRDERGQLQGFARVTRDFTDRHERDEKLRRSRARARLVPMEPAIAGIISGEYDQIPEANDTFLTLLGYERADLQSGRLQWSDLTPPEYAALDDLAHEEGLRFRACSPYEKELLHRNGTRIPVLVVSAVLKLAPFRWITFVQDLRERQRSESVPDEVVEVQQEFKEMVGSSAALRRVLQQVEVVAPTDATVLILGETGTGKELVARALHRLSPRHKLPFITLNCAAIPTGLLESELFGYERGAFTGALMQKIGRFEMAHRGTLFLDEVGDIPIDLQPKLLRALQEKSFERLGGTKTIPIDVRLVAATNRNLAQMMGDKLFRSDLYYRLKVFPILTPPLRDRPEDIPLLARHFVRKYATKMGRTVEKIPDETLQALCKWPWPGNIRELENFMERSVILSSGNTLRAPLVEIRPDAAPAAAGATLEQVEREYIIRVLRECDGVVTAAATRLGLHRTTLNAMMRKLGISRKDV